MSVKPSNTYYAPGTQLVRDKTSYGLIPTPPSPTHGSPTLLSPSNSISNSSNSPPEPSTPPRNSRSRSRYSDLGRVPLHRRGTSQTYERLEDLLREAGYKETRVFTPEAERSRSGDDKEGDGGENQENRSSVRDSMDAVVGFFAGLLPGATTSKTSLVPQPDSGPTRSTTSPQDYSPSLSPLTNRAWQRQVIGGGYDLTEPPTPTTMTSSIESLPESNPRLNRHHSYRTNNSSSTVNLHAPQSYFSQRPSLSHRNSSKLSHTSQIIQKQSSRSSLHHQAMQHHSNVVSPRPSRPTVNMRHMSATSVLPRPNSTPAHMTRPAIFVSDDDSSSTHTLHVKPNDDNNSELPPLPPSWLESVARAVLFGGTGAFIGGPSGFISHESFTGPASHLSPKVHVLRTTRSSLSQVSSRKSKYNRPTPINRRSGLSDQTNSPIRSDIRSGLLGPPSLFSQIERGRSRRSEGEVSRTRVVCRSAPGSRNGSVTRNNDADGKERAKRRDYNANVRNKRKDEKGRLPSLARTQAEGDVWDRRERNEVRTIRGINNGGSNYANRYLSVWGGAADAYSEAGSSSEEEEDEELDLARILVPPKRQNSIRSLRKHLATEAGSGQGAHASLKGYVPKAGSTDRREMYVPVGGGNGRDGGARDRVPQILPQRRRRTTEDGEWDGESQEEWGGGWVRKGTGKRESEDDDVDSFVGFFGEARTTSLVGTTSTAKGGSGRNRLGFSLGLGG